MRRNAMYFNKILVADRSDAACRVIRTCMGLRIQTVAIFTEQESNALHADMANEAYAVTSYSNAQEVMQIARQTGAEAIHPGYGWFSENPLFVRQCIDAGFVFIGPSPRVLLQMGNKIKAKNAAKRAGVPVLPGSESLAYEEEQAIERMIAALRDLRIEGVTGREILLAILHWDSFRKNIHALDTLNNRSVTQEIERAAHRFTLEKGLYPSLGRIAGDVAHEVL